MLITGRQLPGGKVKYKGIVFPSLAAAQTYAARTLKGFTKRHGNVSQGFYDSFGQFHPIRSSSDYDEGRVGKPAKRKKTVASKTKAASTAKKRKKVSRASAISKAVATRTKKRRSAKRATPRTAPKRRGTKRTATRAKSTRSRASVRKRSGKR